MLESYFAILSTFRDLPVIGPALDFIEDLIPIDTFIDRAYDFIIDLSFGEQLIFAIVLVIVLVLGIIALIQKLAKLLIVVAIIFAIWLLYNQGVIG